MWSGSPLKFEHSPHNHAEQQGGQDAEMASFAPHAMPSTPTHHHRRGHSLNSIHSLPRTPTHHPLRPPVYLQSPLATNPSGLMGVGDVFAPGSSFNENMAYYSPVISSPVTALDNLNEELINFDLTSFVRPLGSVSIVDSPLSSPAQPNFPFHNINPFCAPPESSSMLPSRTASPLHNPFSPAPDQASAELQSLIRTPQPSSTRQNFCDGLVSTPDLSPTHPTNPLQESLLQARQPSPSRKRAMGSLVRTPEPSPTRHSCSQPSPYPHGDLMQSAPDLRPVQTPRASSRTSPTRSRQSPSPSRRVRAHQRTQSLASINSTTASLADGDMEQYRVESSIKPEQISELIGETEPSTVQGPAPDEGNKKYTCKWVDHVASKDGEDTSPAISERPCGQFFERKENCKAHIQTHLDDRQYKCPYAFCAKLFVRSHDLRRHLRTHDLHKKWVCPCGRDFSRADALHRHQARGNCIGAPPGTKRKEPAKRGRPPKKKDPVVGGLGGSKVSGAPAAVSKKPPPPPPNVVPTDLSRPPRPQLSGSTGRGATSGGVSTGAGFAPMGASLSRADDLTTKELDVPSVVLPHLEAMEHAYLYGPPDLDRSPSPTRDGRPHNSSSLAPSPLEDDALPSSPIPPDCHGGLDAGDDGEMLCGPPGDDWLEDLIFINDNFIDTASI